MSQFLTTVEGFTPVIDVVVKDVGLTAAAVYGTMWRYCQMKDGVCRASMTTIGERLNLERKTVMRHVQTLCEKGYLVDKTPDRRNTPHVYADAGNIIIEGLLSIKHTAGVPKRDSGCTKKGHPGVPKRDMKIHDKDTEEETLSPQEDLDTFFAGEKKDDTLERMLFSKKNAKESNANLPPRGWRAASEAELAICQRIAEHWTDHKLPWSPDDIERSLATAHQFLEQYDSDVRKIKDAIDRYHLKHGDDFTVTSAYSLRNALPKFIDETEKKKVIKIKV